MRVLVAATLFFAAGVEAEYSIKQQDGFVTLENGSDMRAVLAPEHGGELSGFAVLFNGHWHELLYRAMDYGDSPGWRGKAPLLWPATGVTITDKKGRQHYLLDGSDYSMPPHGFARDMAWKLVAQRAGEEFASVTLQMSSSEASRIHYPFDFDLEVEYRLEADQFSLEYTVSAAEANQGPMPFSIGNHITFKAPMIPGPPAGDVQFFSELPDMLLRDDRRAFSGKVVPSPFQGWRPVSKLPLRQAVSLGGPPGTAELLVRDPSGLALKMVHRASREPTAPVIRFNLWADVEEGFFSPEPWLGTQNSLNTGAGLISLEPGQNWNWHIDISPSKVSP